MEVSRAVPIPAAAKKGPAAVYPWEDMDVMSSVSFDTDEVFQKARRAATNYGRRHNMIFTSRKGYQIIDNEAVWTGEGGTIWRNE